VAVKNPQFVRNLKKFNPKENNDFGGYVIGSQFGVRNRVKEALAEFKKLAEGGFKENLSKANNIAIDNESSPSKSKITETELTDVTRNPVVKAKLPAIEKAIDITNLSSTDLTYAKATDMFIDKVSEALIGVSGAKASGQVTVSSKSKEKIDQGAVTKMQGLFRGAAQIENFIRVMPEYNVATNETTINKQKEIVDVSKDVRGISIGTNPKTLKVLYEKHVDPKGKITSPSGRSKGKTTQPGVWRLKPQFRSKVISPKAIKEFAETIGLTPSGEARIPVKGKARTEFGTLLQGVTKMYMSNVINTVVRKKFLENKPDSEKRSIETNQELADIGAGKSKLMFSNAPKSPLRTELLKAIDDRLKIPELRKLVDESKANKETKDIFYGIISDLDKSFLGKESDLIAKDLEVLTKQAKELGIELPELIKSSEEAAKNWKQAISSINKLFGTEAKYSSEPDLTKPENIERTLNILKSVVDFYPNIAELGKEAKPLLSAIKATVGTNAGLKINGKAISVDMFNEMAKSLGKGKKLKPWMKKVYQPAWGYGNGFKGQTERALTRLKNTKIGWEKDYALVAANLLTNPKLRKLNSVDNFEGYNQTQEANREAIKSIYYGLAKGFGKNKNKTEAIEDIINFLKLQTNHASGIIKGFVPMTMITTEPGGPKDKKTHNEHMKELFNYNRLFIDILAAHKENPTSKTALAKGTYLAFGTFGASKLPPSARCKSILVARRSF
jgi:hypothetical protein